MRILTASVFLLLAVSAPAQEGALYDENYDPVVDNPTFGPGEGPVVLVDEAHFNYHTVEGRYHVFAELLENDGYVVQPNTQPFSAASLGDASVLVIANALHPFNVSDTEDWAWPILSALGDDEIDAVVEWVEGGGALLLVADHMPFPGAIAKLAARFGVNWLTVYAYAGNFTFNLMGPDPNLIQFRLGTPGPDGGIGRDHPIFGGRNAGESVDFFSSFTGSAFRVACDSPIVPLMELGPSNYERGYLTAAGMPSDLWPSGTLVSYVPRSSLEGAEYPKQSAIGMLQGATLESGAGRIVFLGEASAISARIANFIGDGFQMGMNNQELAPHNKQFTLNMVHWLSDHLAPITAVGEEAVALDVRPTDHSLGRNWPNPFNPETQISYMVGSATDMNLSIYNTLGQHVRTLVSEPHGAGVYSVTWDGRDGDGSRVTGGAYFYRMEAGSFVETGKMALVP